MTGRRFGTKAGFTLIELLVVIAVIGLLAALILNLGPLTTRLKVRKLVQAQMDQMISAIESYKEDRGFYPPGNPTDPVRHALYYELTGTTYDGTTDRYDEAGGSGSVSTADLQAWSIPGILNSTRTSERMRNYLPGLKESQVKAVGAVKILGVPTRGPMPPPLDNFSPWQYRVATPANQATVRNAESYDLWVEVDLGGTPRTFGNWKE